MTITSDTLKNIYVGNGSATIFAYEFRLLTEDELTVTVDGVLKTLTLDYTISGIGNLNGGNVTFVTAPASDTSIVLLQNPAFTQEMNYNELDAFPAESHEEALDRATIRDLTLKEQLDRSLKFASDTSTTTPVIEEPTDSYLLAFDGTDGNIKGVVTGSLSDNLDTLLGTLGDKDFLIYNNAGSVWINRTPANVRSDLGLGTAALQDVGTSANNVVQLSASAKLPALTAGANIAMDSNRITGLSDPSSAQDAATKNYVDTSIAAHGVVQRVNSQTGAVATGTTIIPFDDSIPQNTEGDQYLSLAITPTSATNILRIDAILNLASSDAGSTVMSVALFQDSTANALAATFAPKLQLSNTPTQVVLTHTMTAGTVSATTFKIRAGAAAVGTTTFNGVGGGRIYGGVMASSITITEYEA